MRSVRSGAKSASSLLADALRAGREGQDICTGRALATQARRRKPQDRSPLESFQLDPRQVQHMSPHVLSGAVASAGSNRHRGETLWRAYSDRALSVQERLTVHDLRVMLKGYADASVRDSALFRKLMASRLWRSDKQATPRDLASIAVNLAKLGFVDRETFSEIGSAVVDHIEAMDAMDLASVANAFSRAGCCEHELMTALKAEFQSRAKSRSKELTPAVMTLTLNAFAVCGHHEPSFWKPLLDDVVLKQLPEYTLTQAALVANAIGSCGESMPEARSALETFAEHWVQSGTLDMHFETAASSSSDSTKAPENLAYLANTYARLRLSSNSELNEAFATTSMRQLSQFTAWQLALLCGALVHLPSQGQKACITLIAQEVFSDVLKDCSLGHLALLTSAFGYARASLTSPVAASLTKHTCSLAASARAALAQPHRGGDHRTLTSGSLGSLLDGAVHLLSPSQCLQVLAALRPLTMDLVEKGNLRASALYSVFSAHAHLGLRDLELFEALAPVGVSILEENEGSLRSERLFTALGMLGVTPGHLGKSLDKALLVKAPSLSLAESTQALLAASSLEFRDISANTVEALISAAKESISSSSSASASGRELARLRATAQALRQPGRADFSELAESCNAAANALVEVVGDAVYQLEPPAPAGLLRDVFIALHRWSGTTAEAAADSDQKSQPDPWKISMGSSENGSFAGVGGFQADILLTRNQGPSVAVEVIGSRRCYHGSRDLIAICSLKQGLLGQSHTLVKIHHWEWPEEASEQSEFLHRRLSIV